MTIGQAMTRALALLLLTAAVPAMAGEADPLPSGMWDTVKPQLFGDAPTVFDERVVVTAPAIAEDNLNVPVLADARALGEVERIVIFADANPILRVATYEPVAAEPVIGLQVKLQQGGPVRAAALTPDGVWHVGGVFVDAAGGGCTAPAAVHASEDWPAHLGEMHGRAWLQPDGTQRVRLRVYHPMDTGLADGIPAFFVEELEVKDEAGRLLARIEPAEPVSQHPLVTLLLKPQEGTPSLRITGRDTDANLLDGTLPLAWRTSALDLN